MDISLLISIVALVLGILDFLLFLAARKAIINVMEELDRARKMMVLGKEEGAEKSLEKAVKELREILYDKLNVQKTITTSELIRAIEESNFDRSLKKRLVYFFTKLMEVEYSPEKSKKDLLWLRNEAIKLARLIED